MKKMILPATAIVLFCVGGARSCGRDAISTPSPLVLIPGKGGSQLEVKVVDQTRRGPCPVTEGWQRIWMNAYYLIPLVGDEECWAAHMELDYNITTEQSQYSAGRIYRTPGWGSTEGIEYIDPSWLDYFVGNQGSYMANLVDELVSNYGYIRGKNLVGAPYDFRFAPESHDKYFSDLTSLVEETYNNNEGRKIILFGHSMGGLMATYFLNQVPQAWKDKYIKVLVTANAPWDGTMELAKVQATGDIGWLPKVLLGKQVIRDQLRSYESSHFMLPHGPTWKLDDVIIEAPHRNFTVKDYEDMFDEMGHPEGKHILHHTRPAWERIYHPEVDVHCWYSFGKETTEKVTYKEGQWPHGTPDIKTGDGDGSVNLKSLQSCERWSSNSNRTVQVRAWADTEHRDILDHDEVIQALAEIAYQAEPSLHTSRLNTPSSHIPQRR